MYQQGILIWSSVVLIMWSSGQTWMYISVPLLLYVGERNLRAFRSKAYSVKILKVQAFFISGPFSLFYTSRKLSSYHSSYMVIRCFNFLNLFPMLNCFTNFTSYSKLNFIQTGEIKKQFSKLSSPASHLMASHAIVSKKLLRVLLGNLAHYMVHVMHDYCPFCKPLLLAAWMQCIIEWFISVHEV